MKRLSHHCLLLVAITLIAATNFTENEFAIRSLWFMSGASVMGWIDAWREIRLYHKGVYPSVSGMVTFGEEHEQKHHPDTFEEPK